MLDELLAAWRDRPHPELHDLILRAGAELAPPAPEALRGKTKQAIAAWKAAAARRTSADLPALLEVVADAGLREATARLAAIATWDRDPRIDEVVVRAIETRPFYGPDTRAYWKAIHALAERLRDPRLVDRIANASFPAFLRGELRTWLARRERELVAALRAAPAPAGKPPKLDRWIVQLDGAQKQRRPRDADALLAAIYERPEDDAVRLVYADAVGGERGEFIVAQLVAQLGPQDPKTVRRAAALLKKHGKQWLGPLEGVVMKHFVFARGFLAECCIASGKGGKVAALVGHPAWSTVTALDGPATIALHPTMRALRALVFHRDRAAHHGMPDAWRELLGGTERKLERLTYTTPYREPPDPAELALLAKCPALPALTSLFVNTDEATFDAILDGPVARRLTAIGVHRQDILWYTRSPWARRVLAKVKAARFEIRLTDRARFVFERGAGGFHTLWLSLAHGRAHHVDQALHLLADVPASVKTVHLVLPGPDAAPRATMSAEDRQRLVEAVTAHVGPPATITDHVEPLPNQVEAGVAPRP